MLQRCLTVLRVVARGGRRHATLEHPRGAYTWHTDFITDLVRGGRARFVDFDMCPFLLEDIPGGTRRCATPAGAREAGVYRKATRLLVVNAPWVDALGRRCDGQHCHWFLKEGE